MMFLANKIRDDDVPDIENNTTLTQKYVNTKDTFDAKISSWINSVLLSSNINMYTSSI